MDKKNSAKNDRMLIINTTVGEFVEAVYDAAMEEYMDEIIARRVAMQMLIRKLRMQKKVAEHLEKRSPATKKAILRSEFNKKRKARS